MDVEKIISELRIETRPSINGKFTDVYNGNPIAKVSSYDGRKLPEIADCANEYVDAAVNAALASYGSGIWKNLHPSGKKKVLLKLADLMEENRTELAALDALETGRAFRNYYWDSLPKAIEAIRFYAENVDKYYDHALTPRTDSFSVMVKMPLGVVGIITPWNDPLVVSAWKFAPALLMGNSVVMKPAEQSSYSILKVAELAKRAGIPDGVFNVVTGYGETVGKRLAMHKDVRGIFFTGSSAVGKLILQYSGLSNMKKVGLECGGKSPFIVSSKYADLPNAAKVLAENMFYNQGQICSAPSRVIVERAIKQPFLSLLREELDKYAPGNPFDMANNVGCMVSHEQYDKVCSYISKAKQSGATVIQAEKKNPLPDSACAVLPTVITDVDNKSVFAREEIFGPVVVVLEAEDMPQAVQMANDTEYGLAGAVFTDDYNEAFYVSNALEAGLVHINSYGEDETCTPFGGVKQSGMGKDRSVFAFDEYTQTKTVWMKFRQPVTDEEPEK